MSLEQHHANSYSTLLEDKDWAQILSNNPEAQDLLSTAIAHHDQYREEDPMKRKGNLSHLQSSVSYANSNQQVHNSDGDNSSDEGHSPGEGKPAPKKAGRKPLTTEPTNKRKAQNRAAQRAFRDRKERYVKSLEDRIKELEELNPGKTDSKLAEENLNLKVLVQKLETENYFLKEQAFTFDFPIAQPGLYNIAKGTSSSSSEQSSPSPVSQPINNPTPTATASTKKAVPAGKSSFTSTNVAKPPAYDQLPWSPPSSIGDSVPSSPLENVESTPEPESTTPKSTYADNAGIVPGVSTNTSTASARDLALFSSLLDGAGNTYSVVPNLGSNTTTTSSLSAYSPSTVASHPSPASTLIATSQHSPSPTIDDLVNNTPLFDAHGNITFTPTTTNLGLPSLTYEQTQALFTDFRDPSDPRDFFAPFEDHVEAVAFPPETIGGLFNDQLFNYTSSFANVAATPAREESQEFFGKVTESTKKGLPPLDDNERALPCPEVWEHIAKHPNFDDADIDDLCAEMKAKAKCSGHGPVIPVKEVTNIMNRMTQQ
ncbi:DNA-binding transcription factor yap1 [Linnemannia schmuckeri]|uniref:DNA-binding transcription factor yap1 n=1 Tax=Linnemannia schmuckeri TaxID=64567 RepID=A0A9P5RUC0_9FUNG|nr:DNA-binding transcription factor yap1 [Linnemannia schmuckeri]